MKFFGKTNNHTLTFIQISDIKIPPSYQAQQPLAGQGLLHQASQSHPDTSQLVGPLWTSDQPVAETST